MTPVILPFAEIRLPGRSLAELIIKPDASLTSEHIEELHVHLLALMPENRCLLLHITERNCSPEILAQLLDIQRLRAVAIVRKMNLLRALTGQQAAPRLENRKVLVRTFSRRDDAMVWIRQQERTAAGPHASWENTILTQWENTNF